MIDSPLRERRISPRYQLATGIRFLHDPSQRDFPARCVDISKSGLMMYVPVAAPVKPGQTVRLTLGGIDTQQLAGLSGTPIEGTIVRVDRQALLADGHLAVGVRFAQA